MSDTTLAKAEINYEPNIGDYFALLKPRVMILVVFTALVGIIAAPVDLHPFTIFVSIIFIALGGGASGALNMWYESDLDSLMRRTRNRPIPSGKITSDEAKAFGFALAGISVVMFLLSLLWGGKFHVALLTSTISPLALFFLFDKVLDIFLGMGKRRFLFFTIIFNKFLLSIYFSSDCFTTSTSGNSGISDYIINK